MLRVGIRQRPMRTAEPRGSHAVSRQLEGRHRGVRDACKLPVVAVLDGRRSSRWSAAPLASDTSLRRSQPPDKQRQAPAALSTPAERAGGDDEAAYDELMQERLRLQQNAQLALDRAASMRAQLQSKPLEASSSSEGRLRHSASWSPATDNGAGARLPVTVAQQAAGGGEQTPATSRREPNSMREPERNPAWQGRTDMPPPPQRNAAWEGRAPMPPQRNPAWEGPANAQPPPPPQRNPAWEGRADAQPTRRHNTAVDWLTDAPPAPPQRNWTGDGRAGAGEAAAKQESPVVSQQRSATAQTPTAAQPSVSVPGRGVMLDLSSGAAEAMTQAQAASEAALQEVRMQYRLVQESGPPIENKGPRLIDVRMYEQMAQSRNRLGSRLSEANRYARWLELQVEEQREQLKDSYEVVEKLAKEMDNLSRQLQNASAAVRFGVDKEVAAEKVAASSKRMQLLSKALGEQLALLEKQQLRDVPISWQGIAEEVRVMGDFDDWTQGIHLHAAASDGLHTTFEGSLQLPPGSYKIKFLVDGEWKGAPNWPSVIDEDGVDNNVLVVS